MADTSSEIKAPLLEEVLQGLHTPEPNESGTVDSQKPLTETLGKLCQTKILYEGPSKCGCCINWVEQYPQNVKESVEETSDAKQYAILCRVKKAHGNSKRPLELHSIVIQSPVLKSVLGEVLTGFTDVATTLEDVVFQAPFWEFFYRWEQLVEAQNESHDSDHIKLLLDTLKSQLEERHRIAQDLAQNKVITYDYLWTIFPPKALVYHQLFGRDCLLEVKKTQYFEGHIVQTYDLHCRYIDWDGEEFGWKDITIEIPKFVGTKPILELKVYPAESHKALGHLQSSLVDRGRKFVSLSGCHHKAYEGKIKVSGESFFGSDEFPIHERVMVDAASFSMHNKSSDDLSPIDGEKGGQKLKQPEDFPDKLLLLCSPVVKAYGLKTKAWGRIHVDGISEIPWDGNAFRNLVLNEDTKRLIESFVLAQLKQKSSSQFDDIIQGKGQGMIMLLAGEPGVGKTLTAETVAERARQPLYMVSAGELGTSSHAVEKGLTKILDLAYRWNAILLLDESDVFLEQRSSDNLQRNQLVSVFLRMLEYYRGLLFLTTNRLSSFDSAFQSRIHLTLNYQGLDKASRHKIWEAMLNRAHADSNFSKEELAAFSGEPLNGRQIKNVVKAANLLAAADETALDASHVNTVLQVMRREGSLQALN